LGKVTWLVRSYVAIVVVAAAVLIVLGPWSGIAWSRVAVLGVLVVACQSIVALTRARNVRWSPDTAAILAAVVLVGPVGAAVVGGCATFSIKRAHKLEQRIFNAAMCAISGYVPGRIFLLAGGHTGVPQSTAFPGIIVPFAVAALTNVLVNYSLVWSVLWLTGDPARAAVDVKLIITELGYAAFGLLIAGLWGVLGAFSPVLVLIPLFVSRWAVAQFVAQQRAYEATVSALCQAVETKDFYTRGHSERVSRGSVMIACEIGMRTERVEAIRYAGMLHDVGKLGVPTEVLQKTGKLTDEEYAAIQLHPMRGLDIVRDIGFLDEALAGIMHHHERIDGRGYPMGLAGDEIPEFARVLAVADAFDAMTSTRSYRGARPVPEAISELRKWAGRQFDPAFVDAFVAAVERDGWTAPKAPAEPGATDAAAPAESATPGDPPEPIGATEPASHGVPTARDHDDPAAPLRAGESL
jgi:hypothetical protein